MAASSPRSSDHDAGAGNQPPASATWYVITGGNDVWWRCESPAEQVGGRVCAIPEADGNRAVLGPNDDTPFPWSIVVMKQMAGGKPKLETITNEKQWKRLANTRRKLITADAQFPEHEGVAVFTRPDPPRAILAGHMAQQGIRVIAETDDNYFAPAKHNLFQRTSGFGETEMGLHARSFAAFGINVFSTAQLRDFYYKAYRERLGGKIAKSVEMYVCRNHMPRDYWPTIEEHDGPLRVGFMGSPSHVWDINLAYAGFHAAKQLGAETWMVGYNPGDPDPDMPEKVTDEEGVEHYTHSEESRAVSAKWAAIVDVHKRWIQPEEYHRAAIPFDIGVAPLWHNAFTAGKSDIKAIEYTISGAACVVANLPVYTSSGWIDGVNCLVANKPEEYGMAVVRLIKDPKLRAELVAAAQEMVREQRNETHIRAEWSAALGLSDTPAG